MTRCRLPFSPWIVKFAGTQTSKKRQWNFSLWTGFLLVLAGFMSYVPFFALFPITRDFPWVNLLLFVTGGTLLVSGLRRAFRQPELFRGKILGSIMALLSIAGIGFFAFGLFCVARQLPASAAAPHVGQKAPEFTLLDQNGKSVALADLLSSPPAGAAGTKANGVLLIFYRGHW